MLEKEYMKVEEFYHLSTFIMDFLGTHNVYEDALIHIKRQFKELTVTRKKIPESNEPSLSKTTNPVSCFDGMNNIRHHGEHIYIVPHMRKLVSDSEYANLVKLEYLLTT